VLVLGDIAAWHIAVYSSATPCHPACSLVRVETARIGLMNRPPDSTSTPWTGNAVFGVMASEKVTRASMRPRSNPSSVERRYGNPDS
jgi:hypothetical protein